MITRFSLQSSQLFDLQFGWQWEWTVFLTQNLYHFVGMFTANFCTCENVHNDYRVEVMQGTGLHRKYQFFAGHIVLVIRDSLVEFV